MVLTYKDGFMIELLIDVLLAPGLLRIIDRQK